MSEQEQQIKQVDQLRESGKTVAVACRQVGVSVPTYYQARKRLASRRNGDEWQSHSEPQDNTAQFEVNPAQEISRLHRLVAAQNAVLSSMGIFITAK